MDENEQQRWKKEKRIIVQVLSFNENVNSTKHLSQSFVFVF